MPSIRCAACAADTTTEAQASRTTGIVSNVLDLTPASSWRSSNSYGSAAPRMRNIRSSEAICRRTGRFKPLHVAALPLLPKMRRMMPSSRVRSAKLKTPVWRPPTPMIMKSTAAPP